MFCPQCGHQQVSNEVRFCSSCGLLLNLVTDLLANSSNQIQREKQEIIGIGLMIATILMLLNFLIVFGIVTLPYLANPVFLWIWISFVIGSLITGGFGLRNLIRSGFIKRIKEREARLKLMILEQERKMLPEVSKEASLADTSQLHFVDPISITETTTRKLQATPKANRRDFS